MQKSCVPHRPKRGATGSVTFLFFSVCNGIGSGCGIVTSQYFGAGNEKNVRLGLPLAMQWSMIAVSSTALQTFVNSFGTTASSGKGNYNL